MMGLAVRPGTAVEPTCSILTTRVPKAASITLEGELAPSPGEHRAAEDGPLPEERI